MPRAGTQRKQTRREAVTRERIFARALRVIDAEGLSALTMRRLASELGVEATALYHHVPNKGAILAGVADMLYQELPEMIVAAPWQDRVRVMFRDMGRLVQAHPNAVELVAKGVLYSETARKWGEELAAAVKESGLELESGVRVIHCLDALLVGYGMAASWVRQLRDAAPQGEIEPPLGDYPATEWFGPRIGEWDVEDEFAAGVGAILRGFQASTPT